MARQPFLRLLPAADTETTRWECALLLIYLVVILWALHGAIGNRWRVFNVRRGPAGRPE